MKLHHITLVFFLCFCTGVNTFAQVEVNQKIILTGNTSGEKQVSGLAYPDSANSAVNASAVLSGQLIYDAATGTDTLSLSFRPGPGAYTKGMEVHFKMPATNHSSLWVNVNGLGATPLYKNVNQALDSAELLVNQVVSAVYDGNYFQVTSKLNKPCPEGFVEVNTKYCIQQNENDSLNYFAAMNTCANLNGKICTWSEWYYACQKTSLGLNDMLNNYEFTDDPANYQTDLQVRVAGGTDCTGSMSIGTAVVNIRSFRCCYYKR